MPPNLLVKAVPNLLFRGGYDSDDSNKTVDESVIRTDFILQNIFSYLLRDPDDFQPICAANVQEEKVFVEYQVIVDEFKQNYSSDLQDLCAELEFKTNKLASTLQGVCNELFSEGITWSRLVSFFVFVGELTCKFQVRYADFSIDSMYRCFYNIVTKDLYTWVQDHGGWEGIEAVSRKKNSNQGSPETAPSNQESTEEEVPQRDGLGRNILHNSVRLLGVLAQLSSISKSW
ncbi:apoptosis regulator BAX [Caerostris extrusa]|uniref:Apoptosis regulator BAX n=1 Tax=Caerostris extrusa TaxID=172846 RepID=A0AAV4MW54_CAEEX|nr:apoptosis regulator BAX [Caerostris extrusa]